MAGVSMCGRVRVRQASAKANGRLPYESLGSILYANSMAVAHLVSTIFSSMTVMNLASSVRSRCVFRTRHECSSEVQQMIGRVVRVVVIE